jgi:septum site-determining protein MinD
MVKIIALHAFRGGAGKSNIAANMAAVLAAQGKRVGIIDTDIVSPGLHVLFGLNEGYIGYSLNDYLWGACSIKQCAYDVTAGLGASLSGKIFLIPSAMSAGKITRMLHEGYDVGLLNDGFHQFIHDFDLDLLLIDTHPGLDDETLLSLAISDVLIIILRPDGQDYEGVRVTVEMARKLDVPRMMLVVNKAPQAFDVAEITKRVDQICQCEAAAVIPHSDDMMALASSGIFVLRYPDHPVTAQIKLAAAQAAG